MPTRSPGLIKGGLEPLPSINKETGWKAFLHHLPDFLRNPRPTKQELLILHRLTTSGLSIQELPESFLNDCAIAICVCEREGLSDREMQTVINRAREGVARNGNKDLCIIDADDRTSIRARQFIPRRGRLRQYGQRSIGEQQFETIHQPHFKPIFDPESTPNSYVYIGAAEGLETMFDELCNKADELLALAKTLDEKLEAIVFFQIVGAALLHPFPDGNGRSFGAKMVLDLNRIGLPVKEIPKFPEVHEQMAENAFKYIGANALTIFMDTSGLPKVRGDQLVSFMQNPKGYAAYMKKMKEDLEKIIRRGLPMANSYGTPLVSGVFALKAFLIRVGLLEGSEYEQLKEMAKGK